MRYLMVTLCLSVTLFGCGSENLEHYSENLEHYDESRHVCPYYKINADSFLDKESIQIAVNQWNDELNDNFFSIDSVGSNVILESGDPNDPLASGITKFFVDPCVFQVVIRPAYEASVELLEHELGHCLGLAHSEDVNSIMYYGVKHWATFNQDMIDLVKEHEQ